MQTLLTPTYDPGTGTWIERRIRVVGCMAHVGDAQTPPMFRLYLSEQAADGELHPVGVDSIPMEYLEAFKDQIGRLHQALIGMGSVDWAGVKLDFASAKELIS